MSFVFSMKKTCEHLKLKETKNIPHDLLLTLFRMSLFGTVYGWGAEAKKGPISLKSVTHILK